MKLKTYWEAICYANKRMWYRFENWITRPFCKHTFWFQASYANPDPNTKMVQTPNGHWVAASVYIYVCPKCELTEQRDRFCGLNGED